MTQSSLNALLKSNASENHNGFGRFAPSPTGSLHLGNLRTAIAAEALARGSDRLFVVRMEDLDRVTSRREMAEQQLLDLSSLGVCSDVPVVYQSDRFELYRNYVRLLQDQDMVYACFCSRKEIQAAVSAPHGGVPRYSGICRNLTETDRRRRGRERPPAIRLKVDREVVEDFRVDDIVLVRNDGVPAYNLAVVVDDELQEVSQVVRGDDLVHVTPSQKYLQKLLGFRTPDYIHLPLIVGPDGQRLSKRHGDVSLGDCLQLGFSTAEVRTALFRSLEVGTNGWDESSSLAQWLKSLL